MSIAQGHLRTRKGQEGRTVSKRKAEGRTESKRKGREGRREYSEQEKREGGKRGGQ